MQQHVLDDRVCALAVLHDLVEIALQHVRDLADLRAQLAVELRAAERLA
jgi:5'-deoxynucleotidase YfbR-like HD superfamily hydrolase